MAAINGNILFKNKQLRILLALRDGSQSWYISSLAKAADTTYVHACNFITACEQLGIMESERHGKIKQVRLTPKGVRVADMLASATAVLNEKAAEPQQPKQQQEQEK
ncbi:MAG: hypothetical protein ACREBW_05735 [Candidatus Micrarchaeaceae archaeon]